MALTQAQANMVLGPRHNTQRMVFGIPAGGAEEAGLLCLESVDSAGTTFSKLYVWADSSNNLRFHTAIPTVEIGIPGKAIHKSDLRYRLVSDERDRLTNTIPLGCFGPAGLIGSVKQIRCRIANPPPSQDLFEF